MNPDVDTTFLPDRDRDDEVRRKRKMIIKWENEKEFFLGFPQSFN